MKLHGLFVCLSRGSKQSAPSLIPVTALFCEDLKGRIPRHQSAASHSKEKVPVLFGVRVGLIAGSVNECLLV